MKIKLLFNTMNIDNDHIDPIYMPLYGTIIDKHSGTILYRLKFSDMPNFFNFKIEFDKYCYTDYYQPKTNTYVNRMSGRVYNIYLYLNLTAILIDCGNTRTMCRKLAYYLTILQIRELQQKKIYYTDEKNINKFIHYRNFNLMYFIPWYFYRLNNGYVFDLVKKKIVPSKQVHKIYFMRKGGIIETNNVRKLLDNFKINTKSKSQHILVILPANMTNLWSETIKITYDELFLLKNNDINILKEKKISQIIIHECHIQFLIAIKNLAEKLECNLVWIINSLPLRYYFSMEKTPKKLNINNLATLSNIWLNLKKDKKQKYKTEIIRLLMTKFNQFYTIVNYNMDYTSISITKLLLAPYEKYIYAEFNKYYNNWRNKLTNDTNNMYSFTTKKKNNLLESKIFDSLMILITSVVTNVNIPKFFEITTRNILSMTININNELTKILNIYYVKNKLSHVKKSNHEINYNDIISNLNEKKKRTELKILNYKRYLTGSVYKLLDNECCPICYTDTDSELIKTKLICGHVICLECILNSLCKSNKCPICNEYINVQKIAIIKESLDSFLNTKLIPRKEVENLDEMKISTNLTLFPHNNSKVKNINEYSSNIINYLKQIDSSTIILTDLNAYYNIILNPEYNNNINIININKTNIMDKIKKIQEKIKNIIIFTSPQNIMDEKSKDQLYKIINFFQLFNEKLTINKIEIVCE